MTTESSGQGDDLVSAYVDPELLHGYQENAPGHSVDTPYQPEPDYSPPGEPGGHAWTSDEPGHDEPGSAPSL